MSMLSAEADADADADAATYYCFEEREIAFFDNVPTMREIFMMINEAIDLSTGGEDRLLEDLVALDDPVVTNFLTIAKMVPDIKRRLRLVRTALSDDYGDPAARREEAEVPP